MKTYAVLLAPEFRLQATLRHSPGLAEQPAALLEIQASKPHVAELNAEAKKRHVERGMTPTQAMARCAELRLLNGNPGHERSAQDALLQTAETLSPFVEATALGVVTIELPPERFLTEKHFTEKCVEPLRSIGLDVRVGVATSPVLALLAARFATPVCVVTSPAPFLAPLPVDALQPSDELLSVLQSWGIRSIGQLSALSMAEVCERLGPEAIELWERATGGRPRPLRLIKPQEFFVEQTDMEHPVEMLEPLLFLLRRFLEQITRRLAAVYLVAGKLRLMLRFENGEPYRRVFTIPQPTRETDLLFRMLHTHLENFTSESPIIGLELAAKPVRPNAEQFDLLEKGLRDPHQFSETLARLQALLGSDRVGSPETCLSHHPDAFQLTPYDTDSPAPLAEKELLIGVPWLRFRPPIRANVILDDVRPAFLHSPRCTGPITEARGPWLMEGDWWESKHWSREEWDVATDEGLYRLVHIEEEWFLDGIYA
jgi:protein ImuB